MSDSPTQAPPLWDDERIDRLVKHASGGYSVLSLVEVTAIAAMMRDDYEKRRQQDAARIAELESRLAATN